MKSTSIQVLLILAVAGSVFFTNLGEARLWDRDEPRNSGCAREMMERGDLIVPMFNNEMRHQKPVLLYWLMISAYQVFGFNEFSARFWSAFLAIGTVLMTYGIARRLFDSTVAMFSAIILSTTMMFAVAGRAATPDSVLIFCSTLALLIYVLGTFKPKTQSLSSPQLRREGRWFPSWSVAIAMYGVMGLGVLAKGLAGAVLPTAIIGMFLLIKRLPAAEGESKQSRMGQAVVTALRTFHPWHFLKTCWSMRPLTAIFMILAVAAPWYVAVGMQTDGDFLKEFLIGEHFGRATVAMENHSGSIFYYPMTLLLGFFPWSIFAVPVIVAVDRYIATRDNWTNGLVFAICWVCVQIGIFSIARTKLPSYVTPCYPALAMLTAVFLFRLTAERAKIGRIWVAGSYLSLLLAGAAIIGGMIYVGKEYLPGEYRLAIFGALPVLGGMIGLFLLMRNQVHSAIATTFATSIAFVVLFFGFGTVMVDSHQMSHVIFDKANEVAPEAPMAGYRCLESSWVVYANRPILEMEPVKSGVQQTKMQREKFWHDTPHVPVKQYFEENSDGLLVTRTEYLEEIKHLIPASHAIIAKSKFFLVDDQLILIGPKPARLAAQPLMDGPTFQDGTLRR